MKRLILLGLSILFLYTSCKKETHWIISESYPSGQSKIEQEYYLNGNDTVFIFKKILSVNGNLQLEGAIENRERHGLWKSYYPSGTVWSETGFIEGKFDGKTKTFYPNGKIRYTGFYSEGEKDGEWRWYDSTGVFLKKINFIEGKGQ